MSQQDYFILWSVYCVAAFILLLASIFFTNFLWRFLKEPIVLIVAILLFSPTLVDATHSQYAPAIAVMAMDFLWDIGSHDVTIANELTYRIEVALAIYFIFIICVRWPIEYAFNKWRAGRKAKKNTQIASQDSMVDEQFAMQSENVLQAKERI